MGQPRFTECLCRLRVVVMGNHVSRPSPNHDKPVLPRGCAGALQVCRLAFWSSSPYPGYANNAWNVNFDNNNDNRNNTNAERLVRSGEWSDVG